MAKWEVVLNTETRIIEADNWGRTKIGDFIAFYHQPGTKKTRDPFHYIKTADIHEIRRLDDEPEEDHQLPLSIEEYLTETGPGLRFPSMEDADTIIRTPPRQP